MAFGLEIYNLIPMEGYLLIHLIEILLGLYLAKMAMNAGKKSWMMLFTFYAVGGLAFMLAHLNLVVLPFAHLVSQTLLLLSMIYLLVEMKKG